MTLDEKIFASLEFIRQMVGDAKAPAVMWSSGKDSMVLLHLIRRVTKTMPVVFHREPWYPQRYAFANQVIHDWNLTVHDWLPAAVKFVQRPDTGHLSLFHFYELAPGKFTALPMDCYEAPDMLCGLKDILQRPMGQGVTVPWDVFFHGHKSSDVDPLFGSIPLSVDVKQNVGAPAAVYPLRHWTDADIWEYIGREGVPYQMTRYEAGTEKADKGLNPDYVPACTRCLDKGQPAIVFCPKLQRDITNVAADLPYEELPKAPAYMAAKT